MRMRIRAPFRLAAVHTVLILLFMGTLSQRWFLCDTPYDCSYVPFLLASGPFVYVLAHMAQHRAEVFFTPEQVMIAWNLVPGLICLVLGGAQWVLIETIVIKVCKRPSSPPKTKRERPFAADFAPQPVKSTFGGRSTEEGKP